MSRFLSLLALGALPLTALAQEGDKPARPTMQLKVRSMSSAAQLQSWPSGMQMVSIAEPATPMVATHIVVDAGWKHDPIDGKGMSRLFERAWWQSEVSPGVRVLDALVVGYGCEVDSVVDADVLRLSSLCPADTVDAAMRVWSRLFTEPLAGVTAATLTAEAGRVASDARARVALADSQLPYMVEPLFSLLYPEGHAYHTAPDADLAAISLDAVRAWASRNVTAAKATVGVIGGFSADEAYAGPALVGGNFAPKLLDPRLTPDMITRWPRDDKDEPDAEDLSLQWGWPGTPGAPTEALALGRARPNAPGKSDAPEPPAPGPEAFLRVTGGVKSSTVLVGWSLPGGWRKSDALDAVTARVVAGVIARHLDEPSLDRLMGCLVVPGVEANTLVCAATLKDGQEAAGERVGGRLMDQLSYVTDINNRTEVDGAMAAAQQGGMGELLNHLDDVGSLYGSRSYWATVGSHHAGDALFWSRRLSNTTSVSSSNVIDRVTKYITRQRSRIVQIDPSTAPDAAPWFAPAAPNDRDALAAMPPYWTLMANRAAPPAMPPKRITPERVQEDMAAVSPDEAKYTVLANGMKVLVVPFGESPVVYARLVAPIGVVNDPSENFAYTFARGMMVPAKREPAENIGGQWQAWRGDMAQILGMRASAENLDGALWSLRNVVDTLMVSFKDKITFMSTWRKQLIADFYDVHAHAEAAMRQHLFSGHPLGRRIDWAAFSSWDSVDSDAIRDMMRTQWRPENVTLVIVGGHEAGASVDAATRYFGGWKQAAPESASYAPKPLPTAAMPTSRSVQVYGEDRGGMAEVTVACRVSGGREEADVGAELIRRSVSAFASADVAVHSWEGGNRVVAVRARVAEDAAGKALAGLLDRLDLLAAGKVADEELRTAAWRAALVKGQDFTSDRAIVGHVTDLLAERRDWKDDAASAERFARLTLPALQGAFAGCGKAAYVAVIGDAGKLSASLQGAGLTAQTVDWLAAGKAAHLAADPKGYEKLQKKK